MKLWIILPAYNKEISLNRLLPKIEKVCKERKSYQLA